jgi:aminomethyltransferase
MYDHGGFVDDILVHKVDDDHYFLCVNASNQEKDYDYISTVNRWKATVEFASERYAQIAVQGPKALATLQKLTREDLSTIRYYHFVDGEVMDIWARIARTGYTGEDGFEIYFAPDHAEQVWAALLAAGAQFGIQPCGLGARNTLRLEAKMALYGHEIDASITPFEADLGWIVKLDKGEFIGRDALAKQLERGVSRKLAGFEMTGRGIGRDGYEVHLEGAPAGWVTSGGPSPTLNKNIGLCMLPADHVTPGTKIQVIIRNQPVEAVLVATPFYKRAK